MAPRASRAGIFIVGGKKILRPEFGSGRHPVRFLRLLYAPGNFRCSEGCFVNHGPRRDQSESVPTQQPRRLAVGLCFPARRALLTASGPQFAYPRTCIKRQTAVVRPRNARLAIGQHGKKAESKFKHRPV